MRLKILIVSAALLLPLTAQAAVLTVTDCGDDGSPGQLRALIDAADPLDTIRIPCSLITLTGAAGDNVNASGDLDIDKSLRIEGVAKELTVIDGAENDRIFDIRFGMADHPDVFIANLTIRNGKPGGLGGGLNKDGRGALVLQGVRVEGNEGTNGGGLFVNSPDAMAILLISDSEIVGNHATNGVGGLDLDSNLNTAGHVATITDSLFEGNTTTGGSGGIGLSVGMTVDFVLRRSIVRGNRSANGGGFQSLASGNVLIEDCLIEDNIVTTFDGGGLLFSGVADALVSRTTVRNNEAAQDGGGVFQSNGLEPLRIVNSTLSGNTALGAGGGLAVRSTAFVDHTTIADNEAPSGAAVAVVGSSPVAGLTIANTVLASDSNDNCSGSPIVSTGHNIDSGSACGFSAIGDLSGTDPLLGPLQDNGGSTPTHALLSGSPAIDGGNPAGCADSTGAAVAVDQRLSNRPKDGDKDGSAVCDIGAVESDVCGDGATDPGEECDDGNGDDEDDCTNDCTLPEAGGTTGDTAGGGTSGDDPEGESTESPGGGCSLIGANDFRISTMESDGDAYRAGDPMTVYNAVDNEFLVVWRGREAAGDQGEIYGQRMNAATGAFLAGRIQISHVQPDGDSAFSANMPEIAYNSRDNQYLVVWEGSSDPMTLADEDEIFGQILDAQGNQIGGDFRISDMGPDLDAGFDARKPRVAYNAADHQYLVVWEGNDTAAGTFEIYGQRLDDQGNELGGDFRISFMGSNDADSAFDGREPSVAYNATANEYLVVWDGDDDTFPLVLNEDEIFGQRLDADGDFVGSRIRISHMGPDGNIDFGAEGASVVFNPTADEYLVVWDGTDDTPPLVEGEDEIFGQLLDRQGAPVGSRFRVSDMGLDGSTDPQAIDVHVAFDPVGREYMVVWTGDDGIAPLVENEDEIYGQRLNADGEPLGVNDFRVSDVGLDGLDVFDADEAAVAFNTVDRRYLFVWHADEGTGSLIDNETEIYGEILSFACGDGFVEDGEEECDDGNLDDGDGCSAACATEVVGGTSTGGETAGGGTTGGDENDAGGGCSLIKPATPS